jgi:hypothetical protein
MAFVWEDMRLGANVPSRMSFGITWTAGGIVIRPEFKRQSVNVAKLKGLGDLLLINFVFDSDRT